MSSTSLCGSDLTFKSQLVVVASCVDSRSCARPLPIASSFTVTSARFIWDWSFPTERSGYWLLQSILQWSYVHMYSICGLGSILFKLCYRVLNRVRFIIMLQCVDSLTSSCVYNHFVYGVCVFLKSLPIPFYVWIAFATSNHGNSRSIGLCHRVISRVDA